MCRTFHVALAAVIGGPAMQLFTYYPRVAITRLLDDVARVLNAYGHMERLEVAFHSCCACIVNLVYHTPILDRFALTT